MPEDPLGLPADVRRPTRVRYRVLALLCLLAFIFYVDRLCISKAAPDIERELRLSHTRMGVAFAAFTLAYCLFEVPTGAWGDRHGSRGVMTRIVLWWSAFTALTGAALGLGSLLVVRFLFGAGEAGALPNTARILARWFPPGRRGPAQGLINATALVGGAVAPVVAAYLIAWVGWRAAFVVLALPGLAWAVAFRRWFRDDPAEHPAVGAAERRLLAGGAAAPGGAGHPPIPWGAVLSSADVWLLGGVIACTAFNSYLVFSWYPTYLEQGRGVPPLAAGWLAGLVLLGGALGSSAGGFLGDWLSRRLGDPRRGRRGLGFVALALAAGLLLLGARADAPVPSALWTAAATFAYFSTLASWWGAVTAVSGRHLGALFGLLNSLGGVGAIASQLFLGWFAALMAALGHEGRAQWDPAFYLYSGILLLGAVGWLGIDATRPIEGRPPNNPEAP
jgi:MFS family permease